MVEYNHGKPCAIVEYKRNTADLSNTHSATRRALIELANGYKGGPLPCLIAWYNPEYWSFVVTPLNQAAAEHYSHIGRNEEISEQRFVRSLYLIRKKVLTEEDTQAISRLNTQVPSP